jgi:hypothetical protein
MTVAPDLPAAPVGQQGPPEPQRRADVSAAPMPLIANPPRATGQAGTFFTERCRFQAAGPSAGNRLCLWPPLLRVASTGPASIANASLPPGSTQHPW